MDRGKYIYIYIICEKYLLFSITLHYCFLSFYLLSLDCMEIRVYIKHEITMKCLDMIYRDNAHSNFKIEESLHVISMHRHA